jgi:hypothetical protein
MTVVVAHSQGVEMLSKLHHALETVVFERGADGGLRQLTGTPPWLSHLLDGLEPAEYPHWLEDRFPFLDHFLYEAEQFWSQGEAGRLSSADWIETDAAGVEGPLGASAVCMDGACLLLVKKLGESYESRARILQVEREHRLNEEWLEKEVQRRTSQLRKREEEIALRLLAATGTRDEETGAHVRRIGLYAAAIAGAIGWPRPAIDDLRIAAPMHDIGKIGIPDSILLKRGKLLPDEAEVMQRHTVLGARMLEGNDMPLLKMARSIALSHHEKWDGSGYPHGLKGTEIPEAARIVGICDVYDALVHNRVYKPPTPEADAVKYMRSLSGIHFEPKLLSAFLGLLPEIRRIREEFRDEDDQGFDTD